jgi:hypothetical protein
MAGVALQDEQAAASGGERTFAAPSPKVRFTDLPVI